MGNCVIKYGNVPNIFIASATSIFNSSIEPKWTVPFLSVMSWSTLSTKFTVWCFFKYLSIDFKCRYLPIFPFIRSLGTVGCGRSSRINKHNSPTTVLMKVLTEWSARQLICRWKSIRSASRSCRNWSSYNELHSNFEFCKYGDNYDSKIQVVCMCSHLCCPENMSIITNPYTKWK